MENTIHGRKVDPQLGGLCRHLSVGGFLRIAFAWGPVNLGAAVSSMVSEVFRFLADTGQASSSFARSLRPVSTRRMIEGVKISCIANSIFPPGTTMLFARDM